MKTIRLLKCMLLAMLLLAGFAVNAQDMGLQWVKGFLPAGRNVIPSGVQTDANGNVYVSGQFRGTVDFDPGPGVTSLTATNYSGFYVKLDKYGNFIWAKHVTGTATAFADRIKVDAAGNIYSTGSFTGIMDANPNAGVYNLTGAGGQQEAFVLKLDTNGNFVWAQRMGGTGINDGSFDVDLDAAGNVYVVGKIEGAATFGALSVTGIGVDGYLAKLNPAGVFQWVRRIGGAGSDNVIAVKVDAAGNAYIGGSSAGNTSGMASLAPAGPFVIKLNTNGTTLWSNMPTDLTSISAVALDNNGNVYAGGTGTNTLVLLSNTGTRMWGKKIWNSVVDLKVVGADNKLYATGTFDAATATTGSFTLPVMAGDNNYVTGMNAAGDVQCAEPFAGPSRFNTYGISADASGEVVVTGRFNQTVDFDPGPCVFNMTDPTTADGTLDGSGFVFKLTSKPLPDGFAVAASSLSPMSQDACVLGIPNVITGSAVGITAPTGYSTTISYQWQKSTGASGPWENMPGEVFKDLQPLASNATLYYRRMIKAETNFCGVFQTIDSSAVAVVNIGANAAPIANADGPQWFVCGAGANTVTLNGSATGGSGTFSAYQWYIGSTSTGTPAASTASFTTPAITQATTYTLKVTDAAGCVDIDQVTVVPAVANAGPARALCQGSGGVQIGTPPVSSPSVTYNWTLSSGASAAATLSCTTCAQPIANPAVATTYRLTVSATQKSGAICSTTSDVTVTPVTAPNSTLAFAGTDKTICKNTSVVLGGTNDATFAYTWTSGQYLSNSQVFNPTFNAGTAAVTGGSINYTVTATKNGCAFTDEVKVSVLNNRITDQDETICGPAWVSHLGEDNSAAATYTWSVVSGNGSVLQTQNGGENAYLKSNSGVTRFRRTVTLNGVTCSADVLVQPCSGPGTGCDFEILTLSAQGCPKVFGAAALTLGTSMGSASDYNFSWSPANLVNNPSAPTVNITSTAQATITVTITNKYDASITCSKSIVINPPGWSLPVFATTDKYTCPNVPVQIGNSAVAGLTYSWTPAAGLSSTSVSNPTATVQSSQGFNVVVTETASGCKTNSTVTVNATAPVADAGNDRAVCNGATVTLGTEPPAGSNWVYSWEPANTAWTNGTDANDAQPQVQFAFATPQSYILTITDPLSGCSAKDTVVLRNTVAAGEYAGAGVTTCQGLPVQLGRVAEPLAQYEWFMADGVTPATGLSSNTAANPTLDNPAATTTYVVKVSYPGCSTPLTDQVTVTVNPVSGLALLDKVVCPAGPIAIGYGAAGNPAAPAGATYLWSPATGLSSTTAANPTATISRETTYSVTVTLPSGCTFTDQVVVKPSANAGSDATICPGESTVIGATAIEGATYSWTGASIVSGANTAQPTVKPTVTTTYTVSVTLNGCTTTDQVVVTVNTPANFAITGNTAICEGGVATLSLAGAAPANTTWQWSPLEGVATPNSTSTTVAAASTQTYRLTQTNLTTGCSNFKEVVVVVNPNTISASTTPLAVCDGVATALPLAVTSTGSYQYVWSPSTGLSNAFVATPTVTTSGNKNYNVVITDTQSQCQLALSVPVTVRPGAECLPPVALRGNVFHDANALKDVTVNKTVENPIPTLYVSLLDTAGTVLETVPVNADGSYDFGLTPAGTYNIALHQNPAGSATPNLPAGWMNTGENLGAGTGSDAGVNGILNTVTVRNVDVINANFGIQQPPVAEPKIYIIDQPVVNQQIPLDGTLVSTGAGTSSPAQMTGTDPEDGILTGAGKDKTVVITTLADRGELWYNGVLVKTGQVIPNYDPALMIFKATGLGYTNITYEYAYVDLAGVQSPPTTYKISWGKPLPVTLVRFEAKAVENTAQLSWTTTAESNSDRFEVERSLNGKQWEKIGTVNAQGESAATVEYTFKDSAPSGADNYYRLKMIDNDLTFTYSGIRSVSFEAAFETSIFPNPVTDKVNLKVTDWKKVASVKINNLAGVNVYQSGRLTSEVIDVKSLPQGTYILVITHVDGSVYSHKMVHIK